MGCDEQKRASAAAAHGEKSVAAHYAQLAAELLASLDADAPAGRSCSCEAPTTGSEAFALYSAEVLEGLPEGAKVASRGCGDPIAKAALRPGERVLDLGSGGGIDALIAARIVGERGCVYGVDMTEDMVQLASKNAEAAEVSNVKFLRGRIEDVPLPDACVDVIVSNCVVNLCERKADVFVEAARLLAPGGRLVISDIVAARPLPDDLQAPYGEVTGCRNGVQTAEEYERLLRAAGFADVTIEPKTVYTADVLREKATRKNHLDAFAALEGRSEVDGAAGSAIIRAIKPWVLSR